MTNPALDAFHANKSIKASFGLPMTYAPLSFSPSQQGGSYVAETYGRSAKSTASIAGLIAPTYNFTKF